MKKANNLMIEQGPETRLPDGKSRQAVINKVIGTLLTEDITEEEALGMFFWKLADLEPPVSPKEQLLFYALYQVHYESCNIIIDNKEKAFEILGISKEKLGLEKDRLVKEAKIAYWKNFNNLSRDQRDLLKNVREIGEKRSAFNYLCNVKG